jgi:hypothetical protein
MPYGLLAAAFLAVRVQGKSRRGRRAMGGRAPRLGSVGHMGCGLAGRCARCGNGGVVPEGGQNETDKS